MLRFIYNDTKCILETEASNFSLPLSKMYLLNYRKFFSNLYESIYGTIYIFGRVRCTNLNTYSCFILWYYRIAESNDVNFLFCKKTFS